MLRSIGKQSGESLESVLKVSTMGQFIFRWNQSLRPRLMNTQSVLNDVTDRLFHRYFSLDVADVVKVICLDTFVSTKVERYFTFCILIR